MMTVENLTNFFTSGTLNVLQIKDDDEVEMQKVDPFDSNGYVRDIGALYRQTSYRWKKIPIEEWEFYEKILIASCY
jgi:hypothetical protein